MPTDPITEEPAMTDIQPATGTPPRTDPQEPSPSGGPLAGTLVVDLSPPSPARTRP